MSSRAETTRIAKRYARAGFLWAEENKKLDALEKDLAVFAQILADIPEMRWFLHTPLVGRVAQEKTVAEICKQAKISGALERILGIAAHNRRLSCVSAVVDSLKAMISEHKGELTVDVISASPLSAQQQQKIAAILEDRFKRSIELHVIEYTDLIGGMVIRAGSLMIDGSVRTQLEKLTRILKNSDVTREQETMKEVA
ncbi:MAG: F0F1 ATP synthase subunit delta [Micavibrio sp.]|nr:MAG: F0F1 ATP synthase subunit delta [Micavibrio sp.]